MTKLFAITGKPISGEWGTDAEEGNGIPVLRTTNFTNTGKIDYSNVVMRNINKNDLTNKYLKKGDIILEKSGGSDKQPVGRVVYFDGPDDTYLFNNFTGLLRVKEQKEWLPKYVFWALYASYKQGKTRQFENKTTGLHNLQSDAFVKKTDIKQVDFCKQIEISAILDKLRCQIETRKNEINELDVLVKARFVEMFGDPCCNQLNWKCKKLNEITSKIGSGATPKGGKESYVVNGVSFVRSLNVYDGNFVYKNLAHLTQEQASQLQNVTLKKDDVLINITGASVARSCIVPNDILPARVNQHVSILRPNLENVNPVFLNQLLISYNFKNKLLNLGSAGGATRQAITKQQLEDLEIILPPIELQNQFALFVHQVDKSKVAIQKSLDEAQTLFDSLMQEYFS